MYRIDVATAATSLPAPSALGTEGYWTKGNPGTATPATLMDQDWFNGLQESLIAILTAAGVSHSKTDYTRLVTAIKALIQAETGNYAADTGTANAYAATYAPAVATHTAGLPLRVKIATTNTGGSTFNPGPGVKSIVHADGSALTANELVAGGLYTLIYNDALAAYELASSNGPQVTAHGQCRLALSGGNLLLSPLSGNGLAIAGKLQQIPSAGVSLAPTGLTASTLYYIYAWMNAGVMTLEASTTAHATDATAGNVGVEIKSGDSSRTLVGMAYVVAGPAFADTAAQRFVASWFNRRMRVGRFDYGTVATSSNSATFMGSGKAEFLSWGDSPEMQISLTGQGFIVTPNGSNLGTARWAVALDGARIISSEAGGCTGSGTVNVNPSTLAFASPAEGYHYAQGMHWCDSTQSIQSLAEVQSRTFT